MLRIDPGREDDLAYWQASLGVNAAIMRALDATELEPANLIPRRRLPSWLRAEEPRLSKRPSTPCAALAPAVG